MSNADLEKLKRRTCGKPTKSGKPCRNVLYGGYNVSCKAHSTEQSRRLERLLNAVESEAYSRGYENGRGMGEMQAKHEAKRQAQEELASRSCKHMRSQDFRGRQLVVALGYTWHNPFPQKVVVGDEVLLPASDFGHKASWQKVTSIESDYLEETRAISGIRKNEND